MRHPHDIKGHLLSKHSVIDWQNPIQSKITESVDRIIQERAENRRIERERVKKFELSGRKKRR